MAEPSFLARFYNLFCRRDLVLRMHSTYRNRQRCIECCLLSPWTIFPFCSILYLPLPVPDRIMADAAENNVASGSAPPTAINPSVIATGEKCSPSQTISIAAYSRTTFHQPLPRTISRKLRLTMPMQRPPQRQPRRHQLNLPCS